MIIGIGSDIVNIKRIERIFIKYNNRFIDRILNIKEKEVFCSLSLKRQINFLAKRYAAKEAISKALGTGIGEFLQFKNIIISNNSLGKPTVSVYSPNIPNINNYKIDISISDDYPTAIAFAIVSQSYINLVKTNLSEI